jgi:hypothetical protein
MTAIPCEGRRCRICGVPLALGESLDVSRGPRYAAHAKCGVGIDVPTSCAACGARERPDRPCDCGRAHRSPIMWDRGHCIHCGEPSYARSAKGGVLQRVREALA